MPLLRLLRIAPRGHLEGLFALMVLSGLTDGMGIVLLVPLLELMQGGRYDGNALVQRLFDMVAALGLVPSAGTFLLLFVGLVALRSGVQYCREWLGAKLLHRVVDNLRRRCFDALLHTEWRWIATGRNSDHANLLITDVSRVGVGLNFGLNLLATLATMAAYLAAALTLSWQMTLLAAGGGTMMLWLLAGQRRNALDLGLGLGQANRALQGNVQESLAGIKLAKILGSESRHLDLFTRIVERVQREQLRFVAHSSLSRALFQFAGAAFLAAYLYAGLSLWHTPLAELLTLVLVFSRLIPMFMSAQQSLHHWLHAVPALRDIESLLEQCRAWAEPHVSTAPAGWPVADAIGLQGVTVRYPERERPALDAISIRLPARTTTAVVGASGSGKSTLADVLMGLLTPDAGILEIDGVAVTGSQRLLWRRCVAYVPQEVFLFHDSIRNNLLWGKPDADEAELAQALQRAAAGFVFDLPQGLDTVIGDGGMRLSGGERQRLALARALLNKPSLLILDEATSALDLDNEIRIRDAIEQLHGDLTVLIIGHRLLTLEHADQVVVLDQGHIRATGSWDDMQHHLENRTREPSLT